MEAMKLFILIVLCLSSLVSLASSRGVVLQDQVIAKSEKECQLGDIRSGWLTSDFNLAGCVVLNATGNVISNGDAKLLAAALGKTSTLKSLLLEDCQLSDESTMLISNAIAQHDSLLVLNLAGNGITTNAAESLVELIQTNKKLAILDLQRNKLMSEGIKSILFCLEENRGLIELSLNDNGDDVGYAPEEQTKKGAVARGFSGLLHERTDLKILRIGATGISNPGVHMIMDALSSNDHLQEFEIGFDNIGPAGGELIGEAIVSNKFLKKFIIDGSNVGDDGAAEVSHALRFNTVLEELSMKSNSLTDKGARYFANVLEEIEWTNLRKLHLGYRDHKIKGEWYHYIEKLLAARDSKSNRVALAENEKRRVCNLIADSKLDVECDGLIKSGLRRIGDLLLLSDKDCESKLNNRQSICSSLKLAALSVGVPLPSHVEL